MSLQARTFLNLIAGALGGFLAWIIIDLTGWFSPILAVGAAIIPFQYTMWLQILLGGVVGGFIGFSLGLVNALGDDSSQKRLNGTVLHTAIGFIGGTLGLAVGQFFYGHLAPSSASSNVNPTPIEFVQELLARAIGWAFIGAGVGLAQGVARRSEKLTRQGLFGGFTGGFIGGVLFQCAAQTIGSSIIARLLGFVCIGAASGFFIGLVQTLFRQAWIRVVLGRNEGKEYLIDKPVTVIGRSELADIGLFGNPKILPHHCAIEQTGGRFRLLVLPPKAESKAQVLAEVKVNGQFVNPDVWLADGDSITISDRTLQFREKLARVGELPPPKPVAVIPEAAVVPLNLYVVTGSQTGQSYALTTLTYQIGRTDDCAIYLKDDTLISRRHAVVGKIGSSWLITDNDSANGTFVNGERLQPSSSRALAPGDRIRIGETELLFG